MILLNRGGSIPGRAALLPGAFVHIDYTNRRRK